MPQKVSPLWTVATDDVAGRAKAPEEVHVDGWRRGSRGDIGQIDIDSDVFNRGSLRACDQQERTN